MSSWILALVMALVGVVAVHHSRGDVEARARSQRLNPLELKESPYGEVLGMALQEPVHLIWHGGRGHEHFEAQKKSEEGGNEPCEVCGVVHEPEQDAVDMGYLEKRPQRVQLKGRLLLLERYTRFHNSPAPRGKAVREYEKRQVEKLLRLAYEMDPTNYGNYNAYNYFYMQDKESGDTVDNVERLAYRTLKACEQGKQYDPMDALTAASAAENIIIWVLRAPETADPLELLRAYRRFDGEVRNFQRVYNEAIDSGRINVYSESRVTEMVQRFDLFRYNRRKYGEFIEKMPKIYRLEDGE